MSSPKSNEVILPEQVQSESSNLVTREFKAGKSCVDYRVGDDIHEYFHSVPYVQLETFKQYYPDGDTTTNTQERSVNSLLQHSYAVNKFLKARMDYILEYSRLRRDRIMLEKMRPPASATVPPTIDRQSAGTTSMGVSAQGSPTQATAAESRKNRMDGVDVSALPAGFGKRKSSNKQSVSSQGDKRPKNPSEVVTAADPVTTQ